MPEVQGGMSAGESASAGETGAASVGAEAVGGAPPVDGEDDSDPQPHEKIRQRAIRTRIEIRRAGYNADIIGRLAGRPPVLCRMG